MRAVNPLRDIGIVADGLDQDGGDSQHGVGSGTQYLSDTINVSVVANQSNEGVLQHFLFLRVGGGVQFLSC